MEDSKKSAAAAKPVAQKIRKTTIAEMGPMLPLGVVGPTGVPGREIALRPWRLKEERELGKIRGQNQNATLTQYVTMILATMCTKLGAVDLTAMDMPTRQAIIGSMWMPDVFYAYIWLRINSIGHELELKLRCPHCRNEDTIVADLRTTEVSVPNTLADATWEVQLKTPIQVRGKEVSGLRLGPQRWSSLEQADVAVGDLGNAKAVSLLGSVRGFIGDPNDIPLAPTELDELTKLDLELVIASIDAHAAGPIMAVEAQCPKEKCAGKKWLAPIDWGYDHFFSTSSA